ncbi:MAG: hypothetical protein HY286_16380 [Planctomycetes bacterium]|nr:hypothetical protein [Planctomycetota bacterium]
MIVGGNLRAQVMKDFGWKEVDTVELDLADSQRGSLRFARRALARTRIPGDCHKFISFPVPGVKLCVDQKLRADHGREIGGDRRNLILSDHQNAAK